MEHNAGKGSCIVCYCLCESDRVSFELKKLESKAENGCETCSIILEGMQRVWTGLSPQTKPSQVRLGTVTEGQTMARVSVFNPWPEVPLDLDFYSIGGTYNARYKSYISPNRLTLIQALLCLRPGISFKHRQT
jgi:hypothetical protein